MSTLIQPSYSVLAGFVYVLFGAAFFYPLSGLVLANLATLFKKILTAFTSRAILYPSFPHEAVGTYYPRVIQRCIAPQRTGAFLCPSYNSMAGRIRGLFGGLESFEFSGSNPVYWLAALITIQFGKSPILSKEVVMPENHTTKKTNQETLTNPVSLKSIFKLLDSNKRTIVKDLTFTQVKPLSEHIPNSIIKFQAMVQAEVCYE